jgi:hypothetical protein
VDLPEDPNLKDFTGSKPAFASKSNTPRKSDSPRTSTGSRVGPMLQIIHMVRGSADRFISSLVMLPLLQRHLANKVCCHEIAAACFVLSSFAAAAHPPPPASVLLAARPDDGSESYTQCEVYYRQNHNQCLLYVKQQLLALALQGKSGGGEDVSMEAAKEDAAEAGFVPDAKDGKPEGGSPLMRTSEVGFAFRPLWRGLSWMLPWQVLQLGDEDAAPVRQRTWAGAEGSGIASCFCEFSGVESSHFVLECTSWHSTGTPDLGCRQ